MIYTADQDPLCYPGTTVLRNKLDLRDQDELDEFEQAAFAARAEEKLPAGDFDQAHYQRLHAYLFGDVYEWAGELRTIRIGKADSWFCYPEFIPDQLDQLFTDLAAKNCFRAHDHAAFVDDAARFLSELNAIHPFREGNGRTQLVFLSLLAVEAGFGFNENALEPERVIGAMKSSFRGALEPLRSLLRDLIT